MLQLSKYDEAEAIGLEVLTVKERVFGYADEKTLTTVDMLDHLYSEQGKHREAENMQRRMVEAGKEACGPSTGARANIPKPGRVQEEEQLGSTAL